MASSTERTIKTRSCPPEPENIAAAVKIYNRAARNPFFSSGGLGSSSLFSRGCARSQQNAHPPTRTIISEGGGSIYPLHDNTAQANMENNGGQNSGSAGNVNFSSTGPPEVEGTGAMPRDACEGIEGGMATSGKKKAVNKERHLITWSLDERNLFFQALQVYGKSFHEICRYVNRRSNLPPDKQKTREQVRMFYQRMWQKIRPYVQMTAADLSPLSQHIANNIVDNSSAPYVEEGGVSTGITNNPTPLTTANFNKNLDLYALINYSVLRSKIKNCDMNARLGKRLNRLIMKGKSLLRWKGRSFMLYTPICPALKRLNQIQAPEQKYVLPEQIKLNLVPRNEISLNHVVACEQNPRLRITVSVNRQLSDVIQCLETRWSLAEQRVRQVLDLVPSNGGSAVPRLRLYLQDSHDLHELRDYASSEAVNKGAAIFVQAIPRVRSEEISFLSYVRRQQGLPVAPCIDPPPRGSSSHSYGHHLACENESSHKFSSIHQRTSSNIIRLDVRTIADRLQRPDGVGLEEAREVRLLLLFLALSCPNQINFEYDYMSDRERLRMQDPVLCSGMSHILRRVIDLSAAHFVDLERERSIATSKRYDVQQLEARIAELRQTEAKLMQNCEEMRQCLTAAVLYQSDIGDHSPSSTHEDMFHQQLEEVCKKPVVNRNVETFQESPFQRSSQSSNGAVTMVVSMNMTDSLSSTSSSSNSVTQSASLVTTTCTNSMASAAKLKSSLEALKRHNRIRRNPRLARVAGGAAAPLVGTSTSLSSVPLSSNLRSYPPPPLFHSTVSSIPTTSSAVQFQHTIQPLLAFQTNNAQVATPASYLIQMVPASTTATLQNIATFSTSHEPSQAVYLTAAPAVVSTMSSSELMQQTPLSASAQNSQPLFSTVTRKIQSSAVSSVSRPLSSHFNEVAHQHSIPVASTPAQSQSDDFNLNDMFSDSQFSIGGFSGATNDIMDHAYGMVMLCDEEDTTLLPDCDTQLMEEDEAQDNVPPLKTADQIKKEKFSQGSTKFTKFPLPAVQNPEDENAQMPYIDVERSAPQPGENTAISTASSRAVMSFATLPPADNSSNIDLDSESMQSFLCSLIPEQNPVTTFDGPYSSTAPALQFHFPEAFAESDIPFNTPLYSSSDDIINETSVSFSAIPDLTGRRKKSH